MDENEFKQIEARYFIIKRNQFWAFCGGVIFAAVAFSFISYQSAIAAVERFGGQKAIERIKSHEQESLNLLTSIRSLAEESRQKASNLAGLFDASIEKHRLDESQSRRNELARLKFTSRCLPRQANNCKPWEALQCETGWINTGLIINNWRPGGPCGEGESCLVCYQLP